jgi:hypothetical protein
MSMIYVPGKKSHYTVRVPIQAYAYVRVVAEDESEARQAAFNKVVQSDMDFVDSPIPVEWSPEKPSDAYDAKRWDE